MASTYLLCEGVNECQGPQPQITQGRPTFLGPLSRVDHAAEIRSHLGIHAEHLRVIRTIIVLILVTANDG